jgi:hypothetical protein
MAIALSLLSTCVHGKSVCLGLGTEDTEKTCRSITKRSTCIKTPAYDSRNITASCIWHADQTVRVKDEQTLRSKSGLPIGVSGLNYRGSLCALDVKVQVPKRARSTWGAVASLRGGPVAGSMMLGSTNPNVPLSTSTCQVSKGFSTKCTIRGVAPKGMNLDPDFRSNTLTIDFFTTDGKNVKSWINRQQLPDGKGLDVRTVYSYSKCGVNEKDEPYNRGTPATSYDGHLGVVGYNLFENYDRGWFSQDYKAFMITNSTEVKWDFNVTKTTRSKVPKQPLVTFMMRESDYAKWADKCIVCDAPTEKALKGTYCEGLSCSMRRKYLGESGTYVIWVGFKSDVSNAYNDRSYSDSKSPSAVKGSNTKEAISVRIWPKLKLKSSEGEADSLYGLQ